MGLTLGHVRAIPPSTAQRLEQRGGIGVTICLGLHQVNHGLLIGLFRAQQGKIVRIANLHLLRGKVECNFSGVGRGRSGFETVGVLFERMQRAGYILKGSWGRSRRGTGFKPPVR